LLLAELRRASWRELLTSGGFGSNLAVLREALLSALEE
jgi:hypothetical protein